MKLTRIEVFNFRKLRRARLDMSDKQTLLVGANNSGKTSAMKALRKFLKDRGGIDTRDVTASNWAAIEQIAGAWTLHFATGNQGQPSPTRFKPSRARHLPRRNQGTKT